MGRVHFHAGRTHEAYVTVRRSSGVARLGRGRGSEAQRLRTYAVTFHSRCTEPYRLRHEFREIWRSSSRFAMGVGGAMYIDAHQLRPRFG